MSNGRSSREFTRALAFVVPYWKRLGVVALLSALNTAVTLAIPYLSKTLIDSALARRDLRTLYWTTALFAASAAAGYALTAIVGVRYAAISADVLFDMRLALYRHLQRMSPRFFARTPLGDILARLNNDVSEIQRVAAESLLSWVGNGLFLIGSIIAMLLLDMRLTAIGLAVVPFAVYALIRTRHALTEHVRTVREASASIGSFLIETLQANRLVATANAHPREVERFRTRNAAFVRALISMQLWSYLSGGAPGLILSAGYAAVFLYGGHRVIGGTLSLGTLIAFIAYYTKLFQPVQAGMGLYSSIAAVRVSLTRVYELLDQQPDVVERPSPQRISRTAGAIEFDNVSVDLGRGTILQSVSFVVPPGQRLAFVGPSGCGKSTVADLLVRLLDPTDGTIRLDGCDLRDLALEDVRRHIALVDQEPMLLHATIVENIRYARPDAADDAVAAAIAGAGVDEVVTRLPDGLQTVVGERGAALSLGERQRIAIARALLLDPDILVLDEPTASLDTIAERRAIAGWERVMRGRTTILITHDLALAAGADHVVVLGEGGMVEQGTPAALQASAGAFSSLLAS